MNIQNLIFRATLRFKPDKHRVDENGKIDIKRVPIIITEHCTNHCQFCSTKSVYLSPASHSAERFIFWLDKLLSNDIEFSSIALSGGEPFLHEDLGKLIDELKDHYPDKAIGIDTNFFWATEEGLDYYLPRLRNLDRLRISIYPHILRKFGGMAEISRKIEIIQKALPHLKIWPPNLVLHFVKWELSEQTKKVWGPCSTSDCYMLRANGKMHRCSIATHIDQHPDYKSLKLSCQQATFDLSDDIGGFVEWINRYPFDLCEHCSFWRHENIPWKGGVNVNSGQRNETEFWNRIRN